MKSSLAMRSPNTEESRLTSRFQKLKAEGRSAFVTFITAGDPDLTTSTTLLANLPKAGADIIELSFPFSDPMADGPIIQQANNRAFKAGITLRKVLEMVRVFRQQDTETPLVLMGYYNPIYAYGPEKFVVDAKEAGVDGLIIVDLPPEEDAELCDPARKAGLNFIRLVTPTTDAKRLPVVLKSASGFLYYVSMAGITGTKAVDIEPVRQAIHNLKTQTTLPVAVGFGVSNAEQARTLASTADGVIVGSAIVSQIASHLDSNGKANPDLVSKVLAFVTELAQATHLQ